MAMRSVPLMRSVVRAALLVVFYWSISGAEPVSRHSEISFYAERDLADEGSGLLGFHPSGARVTSINVTLTAARIKGCVNRKQLLADFVAPVYRDDGAGECALHGPTLRVQRGEMLRICLRNNLTRAARPPGAPEAPLNALARLSRTNLHAHGMHIYPGVATQPAAVDYTGSDNIFYTVMGKESDAVSAEELRTEEYHAEVCREHMPGLAWYHPHLHGSTTLQVPTASGLIIIEDGPEWLPDESGCAEVRELLSSAPELILRFQMLPFKPPLAANPSGEGDPQWALDLDDANYQTASRLSNPPNPLCCDGKAEPFGGSALDQDVVLLNGGYQPRIRMQSGVFYRWRLAWATSKRFATIAVVGAAGAKPAPCEMLLVAKDGVYLQQIPRVVDHVYLTAGNRAEVLIRCEGKPGTRYVLRAQDPEASPFGCSLGNTRNVVEQDLAVIDMHKPTVAARRSPRLKACTPARAGYTADLRDEALAAAAATDRLHKIPLTFTFKDFGCLINDQNFSFPDPAPIELPLGRVVEWAADHIHAHPFHMHTNPFQLQDLPQENLQPGCRYSSWFEPGDYHDTLMLPMIQKLAKARVRLQPGEYTGYTVLHCHSLHHEDTGCMKVVKFSCPGHEDPQPLVCPGFKFPVPPTVRLPGDGAATQATAGAGGSARGVLAWARRVAARFGLLLPF